MIDERRRQTIRDGTWWRVVGVVINCQLVGFTNRQRATFIGPSKRTVEIPGWLGTKLLELAEGKKK